MTATMSAEDQVVIIGAGPSGTRAAETLVRAGLKPVVIDEAPASGGQIYRRQPPGFQRPIDQLYGYEAPKARRVHDTFDALAGKIDYRPETLVLARWRRTVFRIACVRSNINGKSF